MKKIVCACAAGAATSATVATRVNRMLAEKKIDAKCIHIPVCDLQYELPGAAAYISIQPGSTRKCPCPVINGMPFVTGVGMDKAFQELVDALNKE